MATLRLNKTDREEILNRALSDVRNKIGKEREEAKKEERQIAELAYDLVFSKELRMAVAKVEKLRSGFMRHDNCLRFSFRGMQTTLKLGDNHPGLPVPMSGGYCSNLGSITDETLIARWQAHEGNKKGIEERVVQARQVLWALLARSKTLAELEDSWPEGKPFYSLLQPKEKAQLPAVQVDEVNRLLGLKGTKTETTTQTKA